MNNKTNNIVLILVAIVTGLVTYIWIGLGATVVHEPQVGEGNLVVGTCVGACVAEAPEYSKDYSEMTAVVSAYNSHVDQTDSTPFITSSGYPVGPGTLACPRWMESGTRVDIEGEMYFCDDIMAEWVQVKYGQKAFDIWMESEDDAWEWGRRTLEIKVYN